MQSFREGRVAICNAVGTGVADDKAVYAYVPGPDPVLPRRGADPRAGARPTCMEREDERDLRARQPRPPRGEGGRRRRRLRHADRPARDPGRARRRSRGASPRTRAATSPRRRSSSRGRRCWWATASRRRHVDLRPFIVYGERPVVVPGGLTRVALRDGSLVVNSSQGGGSKDTWVLSDLMLARVAETLYWTARDLERARELRAPARGGPGRRPRGRLVQRRRRAAGVGAAGADRRRLRQLPRTPTAAPTSAASPGS